MRGFVEEHADGQLWLRMLPPGEEPFADIRLFMRGELLDGTEGRAVPSRKRLTPLLGEGFPLIAPKQVHGVRILDSIRENTIERDAVSSVIEADGILLDSFDMEASLRFGDCAPVVVASSLPRPWVLMMHSGYKGTVQNIVKAGLDKVRDRYGEEALRSAFAWVGPCIGGANYPRDHEEWTERGLAVFHKENVTSKGAKVFFDIAGELEFQLLEAGICGDRIYLSGVDTFECRDRCYSYRGGDPGDRMFLCARLLPQKI